MILFNPVFDNGPGGWGTKRVGDRYAEFSPFHNISRDDPPAIVFLGSNDKLIPVKTVENFAAKMKDSGVKCEFKIYQGKGHGFFNFGRDGNKAYVDTVTSVRQVPDVIGLDRGLANDPIEKEIRRKVIFMLESRESPQAIADPRLRVLNTIQHLFDDSLPWF